MLHLVTGGSGFLGNLIAETLLKAGEKVRVFDIWHDNTQNKDIEFIQGDIRDKVAVFNACNGVDVIHHNVAQVPLAKDATKFESVNIDGTKNILDAALEKQVSKIVYTSSSAVFGVPKVLPVTENTELSPVEPYGKAKARAENLCRYYSEKGVDVSIVRPRTILGSGRLGIFQILFEWVSEGRRIPLLGRGDNMYQFVHTSDLAEVCIRAGERRSYSVYNSGAGRYGTMKEMIQCLCDYAKTGAKPRFIPKKPAVFAMKATSRLMLSPLADYHWIMYGENMYFDISKIKNELDFTPSYSNNEMICESYDWYLANKEKIGSGESGRSPHRSAVKQGILKLIKYLS